MSKVSAYGHDFTSKLVDSLSSDILGSVGDIVDRGRRAAIGVEIPVFSAWLVSQTGDVRTVLPAAMEIKEDQGINEIRQVLREIRIAYDQDGLREANDRIRRWERHLLKASAELKRTYGIDTGQGVQGSFLIKIYNAFATFAQLPQLPEFEFNIHTPEFMQRERSKNFSNVYKDIARELVAVERLGGLRDLLAAQFVIDDKEYFPPKTEAPQYRGIASDWKLPM